MRGRRRTKLNDYVAGLTVFFFLLTITFVIWRPRGVNEAVPATIGALLIFLTGTVSFTDLADISSKISGAAITIMATMVMAIALESFGFFHWVATTLLKKSKGSGFRLFWLTNLLCFLMTLFLNNDGSILITTPILIIILKHLGLKNREQLPYLLSGALIATASSAPIGVSNIVNLIALEIIEMDLYLHTAMMFVPGTLGLLFLIGLLFIMFNKKIPRTIVRTPLNHDHRRIDLYHPLKSMPDQQYLKKRKRMMICVLIFVFMIRLSLFIASYLGIPVSLVAVLGSFVLLIWRWIVFKANPIDVLKKTPWHIFVFAFTMYVLIYGLHNIGLTACLVYYLEPLLSKSLLYASLIMGTLLSIFSNIFNNHPALMIGTITLTEMNLDPVTLKTIYLANIIGSDIGSLLLPMGTLATLIWMHILRQHNINISWKKYIKITSIVIPPTVLFTLICLYYWISWVFVL